MVRKQFWTDPYATAIDTRVALDRSAAITVEETIFQARSGGQDSDAGTIGGRPVLRAEQRGFDIWYTLADAEACASATPGRPVTRLGLTAKGELLSPGTAAHGGPTGHARDRGHDVVAIVAVGDRPGLQPAHHRVLDRMTWATIVRRVATGAPQPLALPRDQPRY